MTLPLWTKLTFRILDYICSLDIDPEGTKIATIDKSGSCLITDLDVFGNIHYINQVESDESKL